MATITLKRCKKCLIEKPATSEYFHKDKSRKDGLREICKICRSKKIEKKMNIIKGKKKCKKCKQVYDLNENNFRKHKRSTDGYGSTCINCLLKEKYKGCKDGYKICSKCGNQYPITEEYFVKDALCIDGFRNVCKKCDGKRKEFGYTPKQEWTKEDEEILIKYFPYMSNKELVERFFPTRTESQVKDYANKKLGLVKDEEYIVKNIYWTKEQVKLFWTEEKRKEQAKRAIKLLKNMRKITETKPQLMVNNFLEELGIKYINEYNCKYYSIDNYLSDYNLMIEVQGDYFHCNPVTKIKNHKNKKVIKKDKSKNTYIKKYYGINILYLWEKDIMENPALCKKLITEYVNNGGILDNYHSFNYILDENGDLELLEELYEIGY